MTHYLAYNWGISLEVLTTETLAAAINYSPEYSHMGEDESNYLAEHIINFMSACMI